ncbi:hypothetical protein ARMSODRAFT_1018883 [Armillaria solidipes]|uniref:Uncharacterized protein n=1 Tax=Armillaria solidipes TaxID=1076256 RepID=A0A2H3BR84_9AGAR|nr:hypothetical protein ARMSODRAFT_1018883 [Armillaria solidipes]
MSPAAWAHRRRATVLGRCVRCGSRYEAVDSCEKSYMLLTERILGEYAGESTVTRPSIHPDRTCKDICVDECGREVCVPTTIHVRSRAASLKALAEPSTVEPGNGLVGSGYGSFGWAYKDIGRRRGDTKVTALL